MRLALLLLLPLSVMAETVPEDDCIKPKVEVKKPPIAQKRSVPNTAPKRYVRTKRLFKTDPKLEEEPCEATLPPLLTVLPPEPEHEFTPVPFLTVEPPDVPLPTLPGVEEPECGCFGPIGGWPAPGARRY